MKADMIDKQKLKKLVAGGETPAVISALLKHAKAKGLKELENVLLMMQARLEQNEGEARQGTITREAADTLRNQVNAAILHLLDQDLEKDVDMGQLVSAVNPKPTKRNWWLPLALAGIMVIYIIAKDVMNSKPFGLTVFVHGPIEIIVVVVVVVVIVVVVVVLLLSSVLCLFFFHMCCYA